MVTENLVSDIHKDVQNIEKSIIGIDVTLKQIKVNIDDYKLRAKKLLEDLKLFEEVEDGSI